MTVNINKPQINLREQLKKLERPTTDKLAVKGHDGVLLDPLTGELNLQSIDSSVGGAAADVFVYDTSKDSDGGAWRKRTQRTSWYNETLNTSTRGARREFPAVAVIVADVSTDKVTIYDGDDPDLPMWMVCSAQNPRGILGWATGSTTTMCLAAMNGIMVVGTNDSGAIFKFIEDYVEIMYSSANYVLTSSRIIAGRNDTASYINITGEAIRVYVIATYNINDVAMTVLPNAPIDSATGLPIPTIAVATGKGTSVIKDDGNVVDFNDSLGSARPVSTVAIRGNDILHWNINNGTVQQFFDALSAAADSNNDVKYNYTSSGGHATCENISALLRSAGDTPYHLAVRDSKSIAAGAQSGMSVFVDGSDRNFVANNHSIFDSRVAYITSEYNTGWMHGNIKGAFLSDTDTTNVSELVTNGTFDTNTNGWVSEQSATLSVDNGRLKVLTTNTSYGSANQTVTGLEVGRKYSFSVDMTHSGVSSASMVTVLSGATPQIISGWQSADYRWETSFTATGTSLLIDLQMASISNVYGLWDNVKLHLAEEDRSVKNNPLQVLGTITKTPVATGAELVGYSGFSNSNYIKQSYTSDMDFGTGNFSVTWWQYITGDISNSEYVYDRQGSSGNRHAIYYTSGNNGSISLYTNAGATSEMYAENINQYKDQWACYTATRDASSGDLAIYINGKLGYKAAGMVVRNLTNSSAELFIGIRHSVNIGAATQAKFALMRFSSSIPSPEQIKKMYEDEKCLFHGNAKATLYGSSDAVTALAYDDITSLLHVGTSGGRSTFSGLKRVENTTTAVATAISASNGLVAEQ